MDIIGLVDDATLMRNAVEKGLGICTLPKEVARESIKANNLVNLGILNIKMSQWAIVSNLGSKRLITRRVINNFLGKRD